MTKYILIIFFLIFSVRASYAVQYARPKVCGEVTSINKNEGTVTFYITEKRESLVLKVGDLTRFLKDDYEVHLEDMQVGNIGEVTYKSPLLSERYLVIFRWATKDELVSKVCQRIGSKEDLTVDRKH